MIPKDKQVTIFWYHSVVLLQSHVHSGLVITGPIKRWLILKLFVNSWSHSWFPPRFGGKKWWRFEHAHASYPGLDTPSPPWVKTPFWACGKQRVHCGPTIVFNVNFAIHKLFGIQFFQKIIFRSPKKHCNFWRCQERSIISNLLTITSRHPKAERPSWQDLFYVILFGNDNDFSTKLLLNYI